MTDFRPGDRLVRIGQRNIGMFVTVIRSPTMDDGEMLVRIETDDHRQGDWCVRYAKRVDPNA